MANQTARPCLFCNARRKLLGITRKVLTMADGPELGGWKASGWCGDAAAHAYIDPIQSLRPVRTLSAGQNIRS
jgi:hypothetical protein